MDFCKASDYYKEFRREVVYSNPTQSREDVLEILQRWLKWQRLMKLPEGAIVNAEDLTRRMHCVHVPYLFVQATVSFGWSATVRFQRVRTEHVPVTKQKSQLRYNHVTGQHYTEYVTETEYLKRRYPDYVDENKSGTVVDRDVCKWSVDTVHGEAMKCGAPDFGKDQDVDLLRTPEAMHLGHSDVVIISPPTRTEEEVKQRFWDVLESEIRRVATADAASTRRSIIGRLLNFDLSSGSGEVRSIKITDIEIEGDRTATEWVHLYPVWLSYYKYNNKMYAVEVDAHTGQVHGETPPAPVGYAFLVVVFWFFLLAWWHSI